jgi:hypothetical protein
MSKDSDDKFRAAVKAMHGTEYQQPSRDPRAKCLGCGRPMVIRKRPITHSAAVTLIYLYRHAKQAGERKFQYLEKFMKLSYPEHQRGDETKMFHWGLLEPRNTGDLTDDRAWDGHWRITELGMKFVEGLELPRYIFLYNRILFGFSDGKQYDREMGTIDDALCTPFNLESLLSGNWTPPPKPGGRKG